MELRKTGFTIAEFMISISIMCIIAVALLPILFKKNKEVIEVGKKSKSIVCSCRGDNTISNKPNQCEFALDKEAQKEFFSIKLTGGGAGGPLSLNSAFSANEFRAIAGGAGESKEVIVPSTVGGTYRIVLGEGGGLGKNGGPTAVYLILPDEDGNLSEMSHAELIAYAQGGVTANDVFKKTYDENGNETETSKQKSIGQLPNIYTTNETNETICGKGGSLGEKGVMGEVIIEW